MTKPTMLPGNVLTWAHDLDPNTVQQAQKTAQMPFVEKPLALMADAHLGMGSTVGSVVATKGAIIPSCVGVDIGCGMIAQRTGLTGSDVGPSLGSIHDQISRAVPAGIPTKKDKRSGSHRTPPDSPTLNGLLERRPETVDPSKASTQFGTLGSGNHFIEVCVDADTDDVWIVLHSGSRNPGNTVARHHIENAKGLMNDWFIDLPDPDLAYLIEGSVVFKAYIREMLWAQEYAFENRQRMMDAVVDGIAATLQTTAGRLVGDHDPINCHHNYTVQENHRGKNLWVTRKGAIQARTGTLGVIPGSMATGSFIVEGRGSKASYTSASHGAGRKMSRTQARKNLTPGSLDVEMEGIVWNEDANSLLDEHPDAYKDLGAVMEAQSDLVTIKHRLKTILNYKGT